MTAGLALIAFTAQQRGHGAPEDEYRFHPPRRWRFDLAWVEQKVAFEREGATWTGGRHTRGKGYANDCRKYSQAAIDGWMVIRATVDMIQSGEALTLVLAALEARKV